MKYLVAFINLANESVVMVWSDENVFTEDYKKSKMLTINECNNLIRLFSIKDYCIVDSISEVNGLISMQRIIE